ncbi:MAG TPA: SpoIIE family protein phosphatase, partial [Pilimelia sp.]|nr:SpoIIE family protein phosphatase [Pilimelia sp.]
TGAPARAPAADLLPAAAPGGVLEAVVVPISGGTSTVGALALGVNPRRPLDGEYHDFLDLVGAQVSRAIARQRAYEAERARAAELAALDRAKTQFFANISHEFRTPLTLILGPLGDILAGDPPAALVEPLTAMHRNGRRLHKLVNAVLDFSRLESGRLVAAYAPTDLAACTAHLASAFRSAAERAGLSFAVQCPPLPRPVHVDAEMWEKIVLNLISNAVKHTFTGGITVRMRDGGAAAVLEVIDTGIGIPADEQPYLFERFHRVVGARSRSHEGTGIGLAVVEELAALHGATVSVRSRPGEGSTFAVTVPYGTDHLPTDRVHDARPPAGAGDGARPYVEEADWWLRSDTPPAAVSSAVGKRGGRILVVDDNADLRAYLVRLLSAHWQVVTAADGTAALAAAAGGDFDLVLTDVMMPRLDGLELVAALRADPLTRHLPIVVLTARAGEEASVRGLTAGADDYLVKPFTAQELVARVRANLELGKLRGGVIRRLRALADSAVALGTARTTAEVIRVAAEHVCRLTGVRHAAVSAGDLRHDADGARPADGRPATRVPLIGVAGVRRGEIEVWWDADAADAHALDELARIVALRLENAQLYEAEHRIATTLQHSLLPQSLPPVPGTVLACRYVPGSGEADVGGDWYDAVALPDGRLALVIGDVVGKGVRAAAMMGQVRNALRAYLLEGFPPAEALERLNRLVGSLGRAHFATVVCVLFDPGTGRLRYASAGHPAPVVISPSGAVGFLHAEALGPPVGALPGATFTAEEVTVEAGTRMLFYTDGLVEDRRRGIDAGLGELLADAARPSRHVEDLLDDMLARAQQRERRDDIAVLALEVTRPNRFAARLPADPNQLSALRRRLERFLTGHGVSEDDAFDMVVAVSEAVANAIEHPVDPAEAGVEVTAEIADGTLTVTVSDTGRWRQPAASTQRGRGLALIGALADLDVQQGPDGTTLTITRRLTARH